MKTIKMYVVFLMIAVANWKLWTNMLTIEPKSIMTIWHAYGSYDRIRQGYNEGTWAIKNNFLFISDIWGQIYFANCGKYNYNSEAIIVSSDETGKKLGFSDQFGPFMIGRSQTGGLSLNLDRVITMMSGRNGTLARYKTENIFYSSFCNIISPLQYRL